MERKNLAERNGQWKGGVNDDYCKRIAIENLKQECAVCKSIERLNVHHKDRDRKNNKLENLIMLCHKCHRKIHKKLVYWSIHSNCCLRCGTTEKKHNAKGYCIGCCSTVLYGDKSKKYYLKNKARYKKASRKNYLKDREKILNKQKDRRSWDDEFVDYHFKKSIEHSKKRKFK
jgi:hypothetical protein